MEGDTRGLVLASLSLCLQLIRAPTPPWALTSPWVGVAGAQTPSPTCRPPSDLNSGTQDPNQGTTRAWSQPEAATVHLGEIIAMHLNEDPASGQQSATASDTLGVWAAMLIFTFNAVKALRSRNLFKTADRNAARLPFSTSTKWIKSRTMPSERGFAFFLQQTSPSLPPVPRHWLPSHLPAPLPSPTLSSYHHYFGMLRSNPTLPQTLAMPEKPYRPEPQQQFGRLQAGFPTPSKGHLETKPLTLKAMVSKNHRQPQQTSDLFCESLI